MSNDAPERAKGFRVEWNRREAKRIAEIAQARADALTTAQARIAELEAALAEERNQVARYALRLVEIGEAILGPYDDAYRNSMVPENDE